MTTQQQDIGNDVDAEPTYSSSFVRLVGRLGTRIEVRVLPSGDEVVTFTVIVDRPRRSAREGGARVDAIACQVSRAVLRRRVRGLAPGAWIEVEGSLRRRFWRAGGGLNSATEVDVTRVTRIRSAMRA